MHIRRADLDDLDGIASIESCALSAWSVAQISAEISNTEARSFVAINDETNTISGWCCVRFLPPEAELLKITVLQSSRKRGVGTLLMQHLLQLCKQVGSHTLFLEVRQQNTAAVQFYKKFAFTSTGLRKKYYSEPTDNCLILKKTL